MKTNRLKTVIAVIIFCVPFFNYAQVDTSAENGISHFRIGVLYNSHLNYYGRTDSMRSSAIIPDFELWINKNISLTVNPVFINNKIQRLQYAGTTATLGYQLYFKSCFAAQFYFVKPFYKSNSNLVQSAMKSQASASLTWLNNYVNVTAGADLKWSDKQDWGVNAGIDHLIRISFNKSLMVIDPGAYLWSGTQRFTKSYLIKNQGFLLLPPDEEIAQRQMERFEIIACEFSMPAAVTFNNNVQVIFSPAFVKPFNDPLSRKGLAYMNIGMKLFL